MKKTVFLIISIKVALFFLEAEGEGGVGNVLRSNRKNRKNLLLFFKFKGKSSVKDKSKLRIENKFF